MLARDGTRFEGGHRHDGQHGGAHMTSRVATRIALTSLTASLALGIAAVAWQADRGDAGASATLAAATAAMLAFAAVGVAIVRRHPANSIGWIFSASALLMLGADAAGAYIDGGDLERTGATLAAWLANWCWISGLGLLGTFVTLLFPDGRPPSRRWRPLVWAGGIALAAGLTGVALADGPIDAGYPDNPLGVPNADVLQVALLAIPMMTVAGIAGQAVRYRRGTPTDRQQLRLVAVTLTAVVAFLLIA